MIGRVCLNWRIGTNYIERFAKVVGDMNPVHTNPEFAAKTRFKSPIAHGMTALVMLNHSMPKNYKVEGFTIKFMRPIYPETELQS